MKRLATFTDVAERHLCTGCGACAYLAPGQLEMTDDVATGRRPISVGTGTKPGPGPAEVCPGAGLSHDAAAAASTPREVFDLWGPVLEVWEGYAADPEVRVAGSSGGAATALALFGIERAAMHGVLHIAADPQAPHLNRTVLSTSRPELMAATGSRYAPASPCEGLARIEEAPGPCIFVGKPCDVAATRRVAELRPGLQRRLGLTIGVFCAGTPSTRGTLEMLEAMGVDPGDLVSLRYRGNGWPGRAEARWKRGTETGSSSLSYEQSWGGILQRHRQWRCHVCADHTGEFADVAVGDPWYRTIEPGEPGRSLVVVRTERGRRFVREAMTAGYLTLEPSRPEVITLSQPNLVAVRSALWGRILASRLLGAAAPRYRNMGLLPLWLRSLTWRQRAQSLGGTARRVLVRRLFRRRPVVAD